MAAFAVASCFCTAYERQFVGELAQHCFIAQNKAEFWPRISKVLLVLLLGPICKGAYGYYAKLTSQSVKLSIQKWAFPLLLKSKEDVSEGAAASLFNRELDELTDVLHKSFYGIVGTVIFTGFLAVLVRRSRTHFRRIFPILMGILTAGVVSRMFLQRKIGPAARAATQASRQLSDDVVAELRVADEARAYNATKQRGDRLSQVMEAGRLKNVELEKRRKLWEMSDSWRQSSNFVAAYFLLGGAVMLGEMPFAVYHATFGLSINLAFSLRDLLQSIGNMRAPGLHYVSIDSTGPKYHWHTVWDSSKCDLVFRAVVKI